MIKKCSKCGEEKPATVEYFSGDKYILSGFKSWCKVCCIVYRKAHYEANKEKRKAYYEASKEKEKAYYEANKEVIIERQKAYYRTPKGKFVNIKKKAKERGINFSLPFKLYESQLWGKPCHYCGCEIEATALDRKDNDKGYEVDNVVPCCWDCNTKKKDRPYQDFIGEMINE